MVNYRKDSTLRMLFIGCLIIFAASCTSQAGKTPIGVTPKRIVILDDIVYRPGESQAWKLDLAMLEPTGDELRPALVIIHGGGWNAGDKRDRPYRSMLLDYALKGYVTISVNYRLTREAPIPACIEDCKCAVRWLKAHAKEYRVDTSRIVAYGHSAGAHLVLMLGLAGPEAGLEGDGGWNEYSSSVTAVAGGSPPTALPGRYANSEKYSPVSYISANALPILLIQGTADRIVSPQSTDDFVAKMKEAGAKDIRYERIKGAEHDVAYNNYLDRTTNAMNRFFDDVLAKKSN
ncbi:MAG: alpha/beta hydrolase [Sedimentisphaerales bacterium]|nr:alpha/beta hydrolase [Sedimentisphaerales bacterium]